MVRGTEAHEPAHLLSPEKVLRGGYVTRASRYEPTHAVTNDADLVHGRGPGVNELFEHHRKRPPVRRDVQAAVVMEVNRRVPEVTRQRSAMIVAEPFPLPVV